MLKSFDLISDLHLDFYVREYRNWHKQLAASTERIVQAFAESITPDEPSPVLVIAGDLGHKNSQTTWLLRFLAEKYKHVLFTCGNHDLYLFPDDIEHAAYSRSVERWQELKQIADGISGVTALDGSTVMIDGVTFGGSGMWYDYSYGLKLGYSWEKLDAYWHSVFNDSNYITECPQVDVEKQKLNAIFDQCDVVVTHVPPDASRVNPKYRLDPVTAFYYFDGADFLERAQGKVWCSGHVHYRQIYEHQGCLLANHALGYPGEWPFAEAVTILLDDSGGGNGDGDVDGDGSDRRTGDGGLLGE